MLTPMEVELSKKTIDKIARRAALLVVAKLREDQKHPPEMVTTREAAAILGISPARMRQIADRFPPHQEGREATRRAALPSQGLNQEVLESSTTK